jgi:hypothetical protein
MPTSARTWLVSAAAATGVIGGGIAAGVAVNQANAHSTPPQATPTTVAGGRSVGAGMLQARVHQLLREEHALEHGVRAARHRLTQQISARNRSLHATPVVAAPPSTATVTGSTVPAPALVAPAPVTTHTVTGASGATAAGGGSADDGGGGGHDN